MAKIQFNSDHLNWFVAAIVDDSGNVLRSLQIDGYNPDKGVNGEFEHEFTASDISAGFCRFRLTPNSGYSITSVTSNYDGYDPDLGEVFGFTRDVEQWYGLFSQDFFDYAYPPDPIIATVVIEEQSSGNKITAIISSSGTGTITAEVYDNVTDAKIRDVPIDLEFDIFETDLVNNEVIIRVTPDNESEITDGNSNWVYDPMLSTNPVQFNVFPRYWEIEIISEAFTNKQTEPLEIDFLLSELPELVVPFNRLYSLDSAKLEELANVNLTFWESVDKINRTIYVINLLMLPFKLPSEFISTIESDIALGDADTGVDAPEVLADVVKIELGEIVVPSGNNSLDYEGVIVELVLPFIENKISLTPSQVIGKTISLEYEIDCYNGTVTTNVFNGESLPINTTKNSIGRIVPVRFSTEIVDSMGSVQGANNKTNSAYIRVTKPELVEGNYSNLVSVYGDIGDVTGYIEVENVELKTSATLSEQQQIIGLLSSGVIINE